MNTGGGGGALKRDFELTASVLILPNYCFGTLKAHETYILLKIFTNEIFVR